MNKILFSLLVLLTTSLMGSSFAIGKLGLSYSSPILLVALRFTLAGIIMGLLVKIVKRPHPTTTKGWLRMATIGLFQTAGVMGCIFVSLRTITAGEASILTFINPLFVVILGTIFLKIKYGFRQWFGVIIGFVGVFITLGAHLDIRMGTFLGLCAAASWSVGTLLIKTWGKLIDTWVLTAYQMLFGGLVLFGASYALEDPYFVVTGGSLFILGWLAVMASIVQFAVWLYLLQKGDPGKTSAFLFLAPFFGVISGWILLGEKMEWYVLVGGLAIFLGIFLVNWTSKKYVKEHEKTRQVI